MRNSYGRFSRGRGGYPSELVVVFLAVGVWMLMAVFIGSCKAGEERAGSSGWAKIELDLSRLDDAGLYGPSDGLRALDYEFCIPAGPRLREEVASIDRSARFFPGSPGRVDCRAHQMLVTGNTHQSDFRGVLARLAELPYVDRIVPAWFE